MLSEIQIKKRERQAGIKAGRLKKCLTDISSGDIFKQDISEDDISLDDVFPPWQKGVYGWRKIFH